MKYIPHCHRTINSSTGIHHQRFFCLTLTVTLGSNNLFQFYTNNGYKEWMSRAPKYWNNYKNFAGAAHLILKDHEDSIAFVSTISNGKSKECTLTNDETPLKTREALHKTRELVSGKTREDSPISIPHTDEDFTPDKLSSLSSQFCPIIDPSSVQHDTVIDTTW